MWKLRFFTIPKTSLIASVLAKNVISKDIKFHLLEIMTMIFIQNQEFFHIPLGLIGTHMHKRLILSI
jgi:hypothetical protein